MHGNASNCSEMVTTLLAIILYLTRLALLLEGYVYSAAELFTIKGLWPFKTFLALQQNEHNNNHHELALKLHCWYL